MSERCTGELCSKNRIKFSISRDQYYFCGHSLGPKVSGVNEAVDDFLNTQYATNNVEGWTENEWISLPERVGGFVANIVGAESEEVIVADSTSVNLYKAIGSALVMNPDRKKILVLENDFPADLYIASGFSYLGLSINVLKEKEEDVLNAMDEQVAVVVISHVNYRTSKIIDVKAIVERAHSLGIYVVLDVCHSAGIMPVRLKQLGVDFAVGCTYKYLNGGPGSPAYIYVKKEYLSTAVNPIAGWMGHAQPFEFQKDYLPACGINRFKTGTPSVIGLKALEASLEVLQNVSQEAVRQESIAMTTMFIDLLNEIGLGEAVISPNDADLRGGHVALELEEAQELYQALKANNCIADYRKPGCIRFSFNPLYNHIDEVRNLTKLIQKNITL